MSHLLFLFMCDLTLKKERIESSSYGLSIDMALLVACFGPGQNCITCVIYTNGKSLRQKEKNTLVLYSCATWEVYDMTWLNWNKKKKKAFQN